MCITTIEYSRDKPIEDIAQQIWFSRKKSFERDFNRHIYTSQGKWVHEPMPIGQELTAEMPNFGTYYIGFHTFKTDALSKAIEGRSCPNDESRIWVTRDVEVRGLLASGKMMNFDGCESWQQMRVLSD